MSEQINKELLTIMNEMTDNESIIAKMDAAIFIKNSEKIINEKVAYLFNMLKIEAKNFKQKEENYFDDINGIITQYKQKLNMVYDEFYCQYVNIQNEIQEARMNRKIAMINYQKLINHKENVLDSKEYKMFLSKKQDLLYKLKLANTQKEYNEIYQKISALKSPWNDDSDMKEIIRKKNEMNKEIIHKCNEKFLELQEKFEKMINEKCVVTSKSLQLISEQNVFQKLLGKVTIFFNGRKKYTEILNQYRTNINHIEVHTLVQEIRQDTIEFVADVLQMREMDEEGLENARIGEKMAIQKITKQAVKDYLKYVNKDLTDKMEEKIDDKDNWDDFRRNFTRLLTRYANEPISTNKDLLEQLISSNYIANASFGREALEEMITGLGIIPAQENVKNTYNKSYVDNDTKNEEHRKEVYKSLGLDSDVIKKIDDQIQAREDAKYGIVRKKNRELAVKRAKEKVKFSEENNLSSTIKNGEKKSKKIVNKAKEILLHYLENDKEKEKQSKKDEKEVEERND